MKKIRLNEFIIVTATVLFSVICGILTKDIILGIPLLVTGTLCSYYASLGKRISYVHGFISLVLICFISFKNNLYGTTFFYTFLCIPLQIIGFFSWKKHEKNDVVIQRILSPRKSITLIISAISGSFALSFILYLIPNQQLAFLDSSTNIANICGIILINLRYKEAWWILLINNILDEIIWILNTINHSENSIMMLLSSSAYLLINIYAIIKWYKQAKSQLQE